MRIVLNGKHKFLLLAGVSVLLIITLYFLTLNNVTSIHSSSVINRTDDRELVGFADNVFIGKVISQSGNKKLGAMPETQFKVEVLDNIKGKLEGTIIVNQQGGRDEDGQLYLFDNDKMLELGKTYLFITRHHKEENWHTLVPRFGDILIEDNAQKISLIDRFVDAHKAEIPFTFNR